MEGTRQTLMCRSSKKNQIARTAMFLPWEITSRNLFFPVAFDPEII